MQKLKYMKAPEIIAKAIGLIVIVTYTFVIIAPVFWVLSMSFRDTNAIRQNPYSLPENLSLHKYANVWFGSDYLTYYLNSLIVVSIAIIGIVLIASMAAYCFAKLPFKGSNVVYTVIFSSIMLPAQVLLIPLFQTLVKLKLYDNLFGLSLVYIAVQMPMAIYILRNFFAQIPKEMREAARIDGCSEYGVFWKIMFPMAKPGVSTILILNFVQLWNEYLYAVILLQSNENRTLPLGVMKFIGETNQDLGSISAGVILSIIPILTLYILFSDTFIKSMSAGSVKG